MSWLALIALTAGVVGYFVPGADRQSVEIVEADAKMRTGIASLRLTDNGQHVEGRLKPGATWGEFDITVRAPEPHSTEARLRLNQKTLNFKVWDSNLNVAFVDVGPEDVGPESPYAARDSGMRLDDFQAPGGKALIPIVVKPRIPDRPFELNYRADHIEFPVIERVINAVLSFLLGLGAGLSWFLKLPTRIGSIFFRALGRRSRGIDGERFDLGSA